MLKQKKYIPLKWKDVELWISEAKVIEKKSVSD